MSVKYAILGLLHYRDMHGYRVKRHIERNFGHMWSINYGQIYPNLKKLEQEGLVTKAHVAQAGGPDRKLYSVTPAGREAFEAWLHADPERSMLIRDPFLLRFVFFGFGDRHRAVEMIDKQIELYESQLARRTESAEQWRDQGVYVRSVSELGLAFNRMVLEWLRKARRDITEARQEEFPESRSREAGVAHG